MDGLEDLSLTLHLTLFPNPILGGLHQTTSGLPRLSLWSAYLGGQRTSCDQKQPKTKIGRSTTCWTLSDLTGKTRNKSRSATRGRMLASM